MRLFLLGWLIVFPMACGIAVLSFQVRQTMSGRHLGTELNPAIFMFALMLFAFVGVATSRYFRLRG